MRRMTSTRTHTTTHTVVIFEIITVGGLRWNVRAKNADELNDAIERGLILAAKVPNTMGDKYDWRVNAACIVAYQAEDTEEAAAP